MARLQARLRDSIRLRLTLGLALAIAVMASLAAAWSYRNTAAKADEFQDDTLSQVVGLIRQRPDLAQALASRATDVDADSSLIVQRLDVGVPGDAVALPLPADLGEGFHTVDVRGVSYRVLVRAGANGQRVAVSQQTDVRDEITRSSALHSSLPMLLSIPLLAIVSSALVRRLLSPVETLSREVRARSQHDLKPLEAGEVPAEMRSFVEAVNGLFARLQDALDAERRFIAHAAHELRTPLTALSLQAQRLADVPLPEPARERLGALRDGLQRARHLLDQLLTYARAQAHGPGAAASTSLPTVCRSVIEGLLPLAEARQIDLGMLPGDDGATARAGEADLVAIVRNLVDNALRHAPAGGRVDVRVDRAGADVVLEVSDDGPGIPPADRGRVLEPFFRLPTSPGTGSGLGLSIVRATIERLGGTLALSDAGGAASGLRVRVTLAAGDPPARPGRPHA